jgi:hypothetical protein
VKAAAFLTTPRENGRKIATKMRKRREEMKP